jgi:hypothetical protein
MTMPFRRGELSASAVGNRSVGVYTGSASAPSSSRSPRLTTETRIVADQFGDATGSHGAGAVQGTQFDGCRGARGGHLGGNGGNGGGGGDFP